MIWIIAFIVVFVVILALLKLQLKPELTATAVANASTETQIPGSHSDLSSPSSKPELAAAVLDVNTEAQGSSSHSNNSSVPSGYEYEVFLNFRGSDTRKGFTDFLYHSLVDAGVHTFQDDESLRVGEDIGGNLLKAIGESKIFLPIFSKDYASSKWCLKELTFSLDHKEGKHMILPVFYDVTPTEVQDQTGDYGRAMQKHEEKYGKEIVKKWKAALTEVGHLKGMDLLKLANGYQGQMIKLVVSKVLSELKKGNLIVTDYLVGIDDHVKTLKQYLQLDMEGVRTVGFWGMGGIGKSTLAKVIYNQILGDFEHCSFLKDIRETSQRKGLEYLQRSLVAHLSRGERPDLKTIDHVIHELDKQYCEKKVLIVLDDIDDTDQLNALVIRRDSFGPGSRIIITTRNKYVLDGDKVDCIYEFEAMNQDSALELFCKHSLRKDTPTSELSDLSNDIVKTTGGLPLALEVIGSLLYGKSKMIWKGTLEKLKLVPNEKVLDKLRVSFDVLDYEQKQLFLDVACFFIGEDMIKIFPMWEDCMFFPEIGIDVLIARSLIKIGDSNKIWMHDQIRDLGREIIRQENCKEPEKRSRLWSSQEAKDVLANEMGSSNLEAIRCYPDEYHSFRSEQFINLWNVRFLDLSGEVDLAGDFKNLLRSLRWLKWRNSSFGSLKNLDPSKLVSLELPEYNIRNGWKGWGSVQMVKLKVLNLSYSTRLEETPDFCLFPNLEVSNLSSCKMLKVIHPSIANLKNLTYLDISSCSTIEELPHQLGSLEKLETLNTSRCHALTWIPSSIGNLTSLSDLSLDDTSITRLPDSIGFLLRLWRLSLKYCKHLTELPETIEHLVQLQTLDLDRCWKLKTFPAVPGSLIKLNISCCWSIKTLPNLSNLKLLKFLNAYNCWRLEELVGLDQLNALEIFNISSCRSIKQLPNLSNLKLLKEFLARDCTSLSDLVGLDEFHSLIRLDISRCTNIQRLPDLSKLLRLEFLCARDCYKLQELVGLDELKEMKFLQILGCKEIQSASKPIKVKAIGRIMH